MVRRVLVVGLVGALAALGAAGVGGARADTGVTLRRGWPQSGDDPATGAAMTVPIEGSTGHSGWLKLSSPTVGQLAGGTAIVVSTLDGKVYAFRPDGSRLPGWPVVLGTANVAPGSSNSTPAIGDIDGDGSNDVVVGSDNGWVFAFDGAGHPKPGWPQFTGNNADYPNNCATNACTGVVSGPTLADLDGSGGKEVIVGSYSHKVWVWHGNGAVMAGWPRDVWDGVASSAAVGDLDQDGSPDIVIGSDVANDCSNCQPFGHLTRGGLIHAFRVNGAELPGWPVTTDSFESSSPALADLGDGRLSVVSGGGDFPTENNVRGHFVAAWRADGSQRWRFATHGITNGSVAVGSVGGRVRIAASDEAGWLYLLNGDGSVVWQLQPPNAGAYFGGPVLADVTGDGVPEVIAADANWQVRAYDLSGNQVLAAGLTFSPWNSPAVADLGDGHNSLIAGSGSNTGNQSGPIPDRAGPARVWAYDTAGHGGLVWPQFQSRVTSYRVTSVPGPDGTLAKAPTTTATRPRTTTRATPTSGGTSAAQATTSSSADPTTTSAPTTTTAPATVRLAAPARHSAGRSPLPFVLAGLLLPGAALGSWHGWRRHRLVQPELQ